MATYLKKALLGFLILCSIQRKNEYSKGIATGGEVLEFRVCSPSIGLVFNVTVKDLTVLISEDELDARNAAGDFVKVSFDDMTLNSWIRDNTLQASATASRAHLLNAKEVGVS